MVMAYSRNLASAAIDESVQLCHLSSLIFLEVVLRFGIGRAAFALIFSSLVRTLRDHANGETDDQEAPPYAQAVEREEQHVEEQPRGRIWIWKQVREVMGIFRAHGRFAVFDRCRVQQLGWEQVDPKVTPVHDERHIEQFVYKQSADAFQFQVVGHLEPQQTRTWRYAQRSRRTRSIRPSTPAYPGRCAVCAQLRQAPAPGAPSMSALGFAIDFAMERREWFFANVNGKGKRSKGAKGSGTANDMKKKHERTLSGGSL
ncbi:hypothetical protein FI667_g14485, partial [Globisporangium splendens]